METNGETSCIKTKIIVMLNAFSSIMCRIIFWTELFGIFGLNVQIFVK